MARWIPRLLVAILLLCAGFSSVEAQEEAPPYLLADVFERARQAAFRQEYDQAILDYSLFLLVNPTVVEAYLARSDAYRAIEDFDHALNDLETALHVLPADAPAETTSSIYREIAGLHQEMGETDAALVDLERALEGVANRPSLAADILNDRIALLTDLERPADLIAAYDALINIAPTYENHVRRGVLYFSAENYPAAIADFEQAVAEAPNNPNNATVYFRLAQANERIGNAAAAAANYLEWVGQRNPNTLPTETPQSGVPLIVNVESGVIHYTQLDLEAGQTLNVVASNLSGDVDPLILLAYRGQGAIIASDNASPDDNSAIIENFVAEISGTYTLLTTHSFPESSGEVLLVIEIRD